MELIFPFDLTQRSIIRFAILIVMGFIYGYLEYSKTWQLSYSKFNQKGTISSRTGMFWIYALPMLFYVICFKVTNFNASFYHYLILFAISAHFLKRCFEVLFLHRYSGNVSLHAIISIVLGYSAIIGTIHWSVNVYTGKLALEKYSIVASSIIGLMVFLFGEIGNLYHHYLLKKLRNDSNSEYQIPREGLFKYVSCPHYLFEIISWIGIALMSKYLISFGVISFTVFYLVARSINTTKWYKEKFPNYPENRKSIVPFLL